jgi:dTDP-4-dehydrorhamnose 3,5-epimerase
MIRRDLELEDLPLKGAFVIKPKEFTDHRGTFLKAFDRQVFASRKLQPIFIEDYLTVSRRGVIRGLHYQLPPYAQAKFIKCIRGSVFDVMVDLRRDSPTFGKWCSVVLSEANRLSVFVPRNFATGYLCMVDDTIVSYHVDNEYAPDYERGIVWNDKSLAIDWPKVERYVLSKKDMSWPTFEQAAKIDCETSEDP